MSVYCTGRRSSVFLGSSWMRSGERDNCQGHQHQHRPHHVQHTRPPAPKHCIQIVEAIRVGNDRGILNTGWVFSVTGASCDRSHCSGQCSKGAKYPHNLPLLVPLPCNNDIIIINQPQRVEGVFTKLGGNAA